MWITWISRNGLFTNALVRIPFVLLTENSILLVSDTSYYLNFPPRSHFLIPSYFYVKLYVT